jgi:multiple antibiotic resistance protein
MRFDWFDLKEIATIATVLFAVIDVVGAIPVIIELKSRVGKVNPMRVTLVSGAIMIVFLFLGQSLLNLIGIDAASFAIAGSLIIFFLALEMILGIRLYKDSTSKTAAYVPLAFPLIAGAGTLTTLLSLIAEYKNYTNIIIAILLNLVIVYFVLRHLDSLEKLLGEGGINILRKVFGVILLALAVKLFKTYALT